MLHLCLYLDYIKMVVFTKKGQEWWEKLGDQGRFKIIMDKYNEVKNGKNTKTSKSTSRAEVPAA